MTTNAKRMRATLLRPETMAALNALPPERRKAALKAGLKAASKVIAEEFRRRDSLKK